MIYSPVVFEDSRVRGRLRPIKGGFRLYLNDRLRFASRIGERRFTIAHEIGHTYFYKWTNDLPRRPPRLPMSSRIEERYCDALAAELLMPEVDVNSQYDELLAEGASFLEIVLRLSRVLDVSVFAMLRRVAQDLARWRGVVLVCSWRRRDGSHVSISGPESPPDAAWRIRWALASKDLGAGFLVPQQSRYRRGLASIGLPDFPKERIGPTGVFETSLDPSDIRIPGAFRKLAREQLLDSRGRLRMSAVFLGALGAASPAIADDAADGLADYSTLIVAFPSQR